jgi:hypothetical protein
MCLVYSDLPSILVLPCFAQTGLKPLSSNESTTFSEGMNLYLSEQPSHAFCANTDGTSSLRSDLESSIILGHGVGQSINYVGEYYADPHSYHLSILYEIGLIGYISTISILLSPLFLNLELKKEIKIYYIMLIIATMIIGIFENLPSNFQYSLIIYIVAFNTILFPNKIKKEDEKSYNF